MGPINCQARSQRPTQAESSDAQESWNSIGCISQWGPLGHCEGVIDFLPLVGVVEGHFCLGGSLLKTVDVGRFTCLGGKNEARPARQVVIDVSCCVSTGNSTHTFVFKTSHAALIEESYWL